MSDIHPVASTSDGDRFPERYELKSQAGNGGMGMVYQALDRQTGTLVAIKVLHTRNTVEMARFEQEARVLAELNHPGIVKYRGHGKTPAGLPYLAMEWLEGETLEDRMSRGALGPAGAAQVAGLVLQALAAAHAIGIVHRDIKPSNIYLVGGKLNEIRLLDFGIARRVCDLKRFTRKGSTVGTPLYTSPEQARGRGDVDGRSDIFSLGCVFFEVLTGEPPFTGDTPLEVMTRVCTGRVPPISSRRAGIPPALEALVHHMLQPQPIARPQSASALAMEFLELSKQLGGVVEEFTVPLPSSELLSRPTRISDQEEHLVCAMMVSLAKRTGESVIPLAERRLGPRPAFSPADARVAPATPTDDERMVRVQRMVESHNCAMERLVNRTLFISAQSACTAEEQALLLARVALVLRDMESDARIAFGTGRASFLGRVPTGRLMDQLPALMQGQPKGCIRLDETTQRLLPSRFAISGTPGNRLLLAEVSSVGSDKPRELAGQASPFLGRERDLLSLSALWRECSEERRLRVALVLGETGQGKSRLVREFLAGMGDDAPTVLRAGGTLIRQAGGHSTLHPLFSAAGVDLKSDPPAVFTEPIISLLSRRCGSRGLVVVLEDLHWAEADSLALMDRAMSELSERPILFVGAGRPEIEDRFPGLFHARSPEYLRLRPLSRRQGEALIRHHLPAAEKNLVHFVLDRWGGNPRFLEEMCHSAAQHTLEVPEVVQATVEGRFDGLDPDARRLLRAASIFGEKPVTAAAMIAMLGEAARKGISEWFEILVMRNLFAREIKNGEAVYRFQDRLVREAAYRMLSPKDRVVARHLAREFLEGEGHTLPETITAPLSQTSKLVANS